MADSLLTKLDQLRKALEVLTRRERALSERNSFLEAENAELRRLAEDAEVKRKRAELDVEFLAVSHKLADNPDTLVDTRRTVAKLIRNIDRCLEMLKE